MDTNDIKNAGEQAYGFWQRAGAWVGSHPKTTIVIAAVVIAVAVWL